MKLLVSACLLGVACRYDGRSKLHPLAQELCGDVTDAFRRGAEEVVRLARLTGAQAAILKERSPSCGSGEIYDGTFTGTVVEGWGVTAELLRREGIPVLGESRMGELLTEGEACLVKITRDPAKKL